MYSWEKAERNVLCRIEKVFRKLIIQTMCHHSRIRGMGIPRTQSWGTDAFTKSSALSLQTSGSFWSSISGLCCRLSLLGFLLCLLFDLFLDYTSVILQSAKYLMHSERVSWTNGGLSPYSLHLLNNRGCVNCWPVITWGMGLSLSLELASWMHLE